MPAGGVSPVPVARYARHGGAVGRRLRGRGLALRVVAAARQRRARRGGADQDHDGREPHAAAPPHLVPAAQLVAPPLAGGFGLHQAKLRNASRASPTCSRTSRSARSASPAATASTMRAWSSASAATCSGVSSWRAVDDRADARRPEDAGDPRQVLVARPVDQRQVERAVGVEQRDVRGRAAVPLDGRPHSLQGIAVTAGRGQAGGAGLERQPGLVGAQHVGPREVGNARAAVRLQLDEALARKPAERLAQRRAADAELCGERLLSQPRPSLERAVKNARAHGLVDAIDDADDLDPAVSHAADCIQSGGRRSVRPRGPAQKIVVTASTTSYASSTTGSSRQRSNAAARMADRRAEQVAGPDVGLGRDADVPVLVGQADRLGALQRPAHAVAGQPDRSRQAEVVRHVAPPEARQREARLGPRQHDAPDLHRVAQRAAAGAAERRDAVVVAAVLRHVAAAADHRGDRPALEREGDAVEERAAAGRQDRLLRQQVADPVEHLEQLRHERVDARQRGVEIRRRSAAPRTPRRRQVEQRRGRDRLGDGDRLLDGAAAAAGALVADLDQHADRARRAGRRQLALHDLDARDRVGQAVELERRIAGQLGRHVAQGGRLDQLVGVDDPRHPDLAVHPQVPRRRAGERPRPGGQLPLEDLRRHRRLAVRRQQQAALRAPAAIAAMLSASGSRSSTITGVGRSPRRTFQPCLPMSASSISETSSGRPL